MALIKKRKGQRAKKVSKAEAKRRHEKSMDPSWLERRDIKFKDREGYIYVGAKRKSKPSGEDAASQIVRDVSKKEKVRVSGGEPPLPKKRAPKKKIEKKATPNPKWKAVRRSAKAMSSTKRVQK